jgi:hypothetical protein
MLAFTEPAGVVTNTHGFGQIVVNFFVGQYTSWADIQSTLISINLSCRGGYNCFIILHSHDRGPAGIFHAIMMNITPNH